MSRFCQEEYILYDNYKYFNSHLVKNRLISKIKSEIDPKYFVNRNFVKLNEIIKKCDSLRKKGIEPVLKVKRNDFDIFVYFIYVGLFDDYVNWINKVYEKIKNIRKKGEFNEVC